MPFNVGKPQPQAVGNQGGGTSLQQLQQEINQRLDMQQQKLDSISETVTNNSTALQGAIGGGTPQAADPTQPGGKGGPDETGHFRGGLEATLERGEVYTGPGAAMKKTEEQPITTGNTSSYVPGDDLDFSNLNFGDASVLGTGLGK